jgi:hypothetical protein
VYKSVCCLCAVLPALHEGCCRNLFVGLSNAIFDGYGPHGSEIAASMALTLLRLGGGAGVHVSQRGCRLASLMSNKLTHFSK